MSAPATETAPVVPAPALTEVQEVVVAAAKPAVTRERIARLAYSYWLGRGCQGGSPLEDWVRAETELAQ